MQAVVIFPEWTWGVVEVLLLVAVEVENPNPVRVTLQTPTPPRVEALACAAEIVAQAGRSFDLGRAP